MNRAKLPQVFVMAGNSPLGEVKSTRTPAHGGQIFSTKAASPRVTSSITSPMQRSGHADAQQRSGPIARRLASRPRWERNASERLVSTTYEPSQVDVTSQVLQLRQAGVNAIISQGGVAGHQRGQVHEPDRLEPDGLSVWRRQRPQGDPGCDRTGGSKGLYTPLWLKDPNDPQWANDPAVAAYKQAIQKYGEGAIPRTLSQQMVMPRARRSSPR